MLFRQRNNALGRSRKSGARRSGNHAIEKRDGKFIVRGLNTGRILGRHKTYVEALNQLRAVERSMHGR